MEAIAGKGQLGKPPQRLWRTKNPLHILCSACDLQLHRLNACMESLTYIHSLYTMVLSFRSCTCACWKREAHAGACLLLGGGGGGGEGLEGRGAINTAGKDKGGLCARASTSGHVLSLTHQADCVQDLHYLASITLDSGKVFALFVKSPARVSLSVHTPAPFAAGFCKSLYRLACCSSGSVTDTGLVVQTFATERPKLEKVIETFKIMK